MVGHFSYSAFLFNIIAAANVIAQKPTKRWQHEAGKASIQGSIQDSEHIAFSIQVRRRVEYLEIKQYSDRLYGIEYTLKTADATKNKC